MNKVTGQEIRKLKRSELVELLFEVSKENEELKAKIAELEEKLSSREISIAKAGSIAEASLVLNGVFEAAEKASLQYLENVKRLYEGKDNVAEKLQQEARQKASEIIERANEYERNVRARADEYSEGVHKKVEKLLQDSYGLMTRLQAKKTQSNEDK
ncbi:MAG: hypothetical protein KBS63_06350 [Clostridiales bacterium]|nr:hypothetical protein [Candidatus Crickella caballi]